MNKKVLIVEDQFVEANDLRLMLRRAGYEVCGIARSVEMAQEIIKNEKPGLVLLDIFLQGELTGLDLARELKENNIAFIYLSANSNEEILSVAKTTEPYGFIVKPFRDRDLLVTLEIARYHHEQSRESRYRRETEVTEQLEKTLNSTAGHKEKLLQAGKIIQQEIPFDYLVVDADDAGETGNWSTSFLRIGFNEYQTIGIKELSTISGSPTADLARMITAFGKATNPVFYCNEAFEKMATQSPQIRLVRDTFQMKSLLLYPLSTDGIGNITLCFYSRRPDTYNIEHIALLTRLHRTLVKIFAGKAESLIRQNALFQHDHSSSPDIGFEGMVGNSHLLLNVFDLIKQVAPFDTAVLVLGESGTGKEKIAECIHNNSPRNGKPLVKVNCATLPPTLIESELFGHEKGAFTGAVTKRTGKFEMADGGTIFLDEIGEMPVDLQAKLLRVLQEKEIEPIGGRSPVKIDVRVIAATNRNLEKEVGEGRFRLDLYYRLNVFPIVLPALRERREDITALCNHFIRIYNRKCGKKISGISDNVLEDMMAYEWPGNIRELENLVERGVLLAKGDTVEDISLPARQAPAVQRNSTEHTIPDNERDYIISVLKKCKSKIWGVGGAAEMLNIPPSTLKSRMKRLGIQKDDITLKYPE